MPRETGLEFGGKVSKVGEFGDFRNRHSTFLPHGDQHNLIRTYLALLYAPAKSEVSLPDADE